ncbi:membrane anchor subunit of succinate dehydrogenase, Sdh4 [Coniosporium apollinis]|uniref:Succinate dehydrogenase [ubiquinone] cytochrome b small subunit n=2 Tax=Coniosporium TaxID=2810619 RepID=A0ABQ9P7W5_9PEZI|nr:membrane anchor subunit of succinate dehydrogenase, Sdh4 [Cladosporium sp. JES 115]KAJ9668467.1 membrane anchor subunit of succinate dehydrogenase, Sdh4 [Coniosporium apollinis]
MASVIRPTLLRQAFAAPSKRVLSTSTIASSAFKSSTLSSRRPLQSALAQDALPKSARIAAFHGTGSRMILPPLPQRIQGTVNDPASVPDPTPAHGSYHWTFERIVAAGLVPLTIAPFAAGSLNPLTDATLCALVLIHSHIGFESIIIDYVPTHRMPGVRKLFMWGLKLATLLVGVGLYEFETNDVGVTEAVKRIWKA